MILDWRTRTVGGVPTVDIRITRESDDVWCVGEVQREIDRWEVRISVSATSASATVGAAFVYDTNNEIITLTYSNVPRRFLQLIRAIRNPSSNLFQLQWSSRPSRPTSGGAYETMPTPDSVGFDRDIDCPDTDPTTDSNWSFLDRMEAIAAPVSTDSNWSFLDRMDVFAEDSTDSEWSSLQRMDAFAEASTDSDWSSLIRLASEPNSPPVWNLPSAFNVTIDNSITLDLLNYCSDPDGDSLSFTASESSSFFSISLSDNILTISGGPDDRRPAGNISLVASDGQATTPASVPVNVLDTSQNAAPVIIPPVPSSSPVIIDGRGTGGGRVFATNQYTATDSDGDTIPTWGADPPNSWRVESEGALSISTVPNAHQTGFVQLSAIQDYFNRFTIFSSSLTPESAIRGVQFQIRCRDSRRAWSNYVDDEVSLLQPVHGSTHSVDSFTQRPDRRQPNIWAFRKESTAGTNAGGTNYQYATPDEARADKANWAGTIRYAARRLYELIQGTRPLIVIHSIRNVHSSLNAVLDDGDVIFTVKPDAPLSDVGEYSSGHQYVSLCQVLVDGGGAGNPDFWETVSGFLFITGGAAPTVTLLTDGQDVSTYAVALNTEVTFSWDVANVASLTFQLGSGQPLPFDLDASISLPFGIVGVFTYRVNATGTNGEVVTDEVVITVTEPSTDSEWSSLAQMTAGPSADSDWSSLERMAPDASADSDWSSLERMAPPAPSTDSNWSSLEQMPELSTDSEWSTLEQMPPDISADSDWSSLIGISALNQPPVCAPLPNRTVVNGEALNVDLTSFLSDPDGDSITIAVSENDSNISISNLSASGHSFRINGLSVGTATVTVTPTDEHGLQGAACTFTIQVQDAAGVWCRDINLAIIARASRHEIIRPAIYDAMGAFLPSTIQLRNLSSGLRADILTLPFPPIFRLLAPFLVGNYSLEYRLRDGSSQWTDWCVLTLAVIDPTADGPWSDLLITSTQDGPWSAIIPTPTRDGPWSNLVDVMTRDGPWSPHCRAA